MRPLSLGYIWSHSISSDSAALHAIPRFVKATIGASGHISWALAIKLLPSPQHPRSILVLSIWNWKNVINAVYAIYWHNHPFSGFPSSFSDLILRVLGDIFKFTSCSTSLWKARHLLEEVCQVWASFLSFVPRAGEHECGWRGWWAAPASDYCWVWDGWYWPSRAVAASQWQPSQLAARWTEWQQPAGVPMKTSSHVIFGRQAAGAWSGRCASW